MCRWCQDSNIFLHDYITPWENITLLAVHRNVIFHDRPGQYLNILALNFTNSVNVCEIHCIKLCYTEIYFDSLLNFILLIVNYTGEGLVESTGSPDSSIALFSERCSPDENNTMEVTEGQYIIQLPCESIKTQHFLFVCCLQNRV